MTAEEQRRLEDLEAENYRLQCEVKALAGERDRVEAEAVRVAARNRDLSHRLVAAEGAQRVFWEETRRLLARIEQLEAENE